MAESRFSKALREAVVVNKPSIKIDIILDKLKPAERREVLETLLDDATSDKIVADALTKIGHPVTDTAVKTWRRNPDKRKERDER
jgi:hypothetical protein